MLCRAAPFALALALVAGCHDPAAAPDAGRPPAKPAPAKPAEAPKPAASLYERLGGEKAIVAVVDDFVARAKADPAIKARFVGANVPRIRSGIVAMIGQASGGPQVYRGPDMKLVHQGMAVTDGEFAALAIDLGGALGKLGVPEAESAEVMAIIASTRRDVVERPPSADERLARIEAELKRIETRLDQALRAVESSPHPKVAEAEHAAAAAPPPPPKPAGPPVHAAPWTAEEKKLAEKWIAERYGAAATATQGDPHDELVGRHLPLTRFYSSSGDVVDLKDYEGKKKLVLVILRGFAGQVCLHCSSQTIALANAIEKFKAKNAEIMLVYPGAAETVPAFIEAVQNLREGFTPPFPIVLDVDLAAVRTFRIEGSLAKPTSLVIDEHGFVRYAYVGRQPADRPSAEDLLKAIDHLGPGAP